MFDGLSPAVIDSAGFTRLGDNIETAREVQSSVSMISVKWVLRHIS